jgi:ADP-ribose pyrophosphatase YjhB (NUDIX family)
MPALGATVAIIHDDRILLTLRNDFEVWCLPGGHVDDGEALAQAAVREAREETGLEVELTRLVGVYSKAGWFTAGIHLILFAARPVGGVLQPQPGEVIEARYFGRDELPDPIVWGHREQILDALAGVGGAAVRSNMIGGPLGPGITRAALYAMRDRSGLSKQAYYLRHLAPAAAEQMRADVAGHGAGTAGPGQADRSGPPSRVAGGSTPDRGAAPAASIGATKDQ